MTAPAASWQQYLNRRMLICVFLGFTSGLPLFILLSLLQAWLAKSGLNVKTLGLFALVMFPYTWKFVWSPLMDRFHFGRIGRRRGWMVFTQLLLFLAIGGMGMLDPLTDVSTIAFMASVVAFLSASQDIAIDAYRREILPEAELGLGSAIHVNAYKLSGMVPGALSLVLADQMPWPTVFWITAAFMLPGLLCSLVVKEPKVYGTPPKSLTEAVVLPFREFIARGGWGNALWVLGFIFLYKLGDSMATALATIFTHRPRLLDDGDRRGLQDHQPVGQCGRRHHRRHLDGAAGHQSRTVGVRSAAGGAHPRVCLAGPRRCQPAGAGGGDRAGSLWCGPGDHGLRGLHHARDRSALHRHPVCPVHQFDGRASNFCEFFGGLYRRRHRLVKFFSNLFRSGLAWNADVA